MDHSSLPLGAIWRLHDCCGGATLESSDGGWDYAYLFPNEESLERLVTAVLVEISDAWESGKSYLKPQN